ncbi:anthranilate synthase component 1 [Methanolinea mesophila]|uniref:anthranilate synthase component I family protein n=1 Tax=Methanolinea mesophila TaxID=547055 RepID=UPI001AE97A04|nr:anthranilate synthase component I family protein [Methanolinea mesophila]MBP1929316.1 anthranilate synthase component 1 [Methanolinea mesophila]
MAKCGIDDAALVLNLGYDEFYTLVRNRDMPVFVPLCLECPLPGITPPAVYSGLNPQTGFLLESMEGPSRNARYSFLGVRPDLELRLGRTTWCEGDETLISFFSGLAGENPIARLQDLLARYTVAGPRFPRYSGGLVGYCTYDLVKDLEPRVDISGKRNPEDNYARFMLSRDNLVFDHEAGILRIVCNALVMPSTHPEDEYYRCRARIFDLLEKIGTIGDRNDGPAGHYTPSAKSGPRRSNMSRREFEDAVMVVKEHIRAGDIFQAVISRRIDCALEGDSFALYEALRRINPSPYMYYLDFGDTKVIGSSPEMLVRVEGRRVTTVPIAGTRLRGRTREEDALLEQNLLSDEKERAEHTMLVDLARNDLGRVCSFGTVGVTEFMSVEKFSHVQHLVSVVEGELSPVLHPAAALISCFPAGTVSGAPKIRAMQIIDSLEPDPRGIYAGAVGYFGLDGNMEFAITIRTIVVKDRVASFQVGAGIVADSDPAREWEETEHKAGAMLRALESAGGSPS